VALDIETALALNLANMKRTENDFLVWRDRFKTNVLAQAATADWSFGTMRRRNVFPTIQHSNNPTLQQSITPFLAAHPAYTVALGNLLVIEGAEDTTDLTTSKPTLSGADQTDGVVQLDFDKSVSDGVNIYAKRGDEPDFTFLARDTASPYIDNRPLLVATKPELREYKCVYVLNDEEIGLFSDDVVVNCAP